MTMSVYQTFCEDDEINKKEIKRGFRLRPRGWVFLFSHRLASCVLTSHHNLLGGYDRALGWDANVRWAHECSLAARGYCWALGDPAPRAGGTARRCGHTGTWLLTKYHLPPGMFIPYSQKLLLDLFTVTERTSGALKLLLYTPAMNTRVKRLTASGFPISPITEHMLSTPHVFTLSGIGFLELCARQVPWEKNVTKQKKKHEKQRVLILVTNAPQVSEEWKYKLHRRETHLYMTTHCRRNELATESCEFAIELRCRLKPQDERNYRDTSTCGTATVSNAFS